MAGAALLLMSLSLCNCAEVQSRNCDAGEFRSRFDLAREVRDSEWLGDADCIAYAMHETSPAAFAAAAQTQTVPAAMTLNAPTGGKARMPAVPPLPVAEAAALRLPAVPRTDFQTRPN